jgi:alpha,alpha-trehalase
MRNDTYLQWKELDDQIRTWWDQELRLAREEQLHDPASNEIWSPSEEHKERKKGKVQPPTLLYLPHPYITAGGGESAFPEMYCWDTYFINMALVCHERYDIIRYHILNQLFLVDRYGMVLTGNRTYYLGRSQTPLHSGSVRLYVEGSGDRDMLLRAYPVLKQEYVKYWCANHHSTPIGLATNRDLTELKAPSAEYDIDESLRPELASEAEVADFTATFAGDIRQCTPLQTNCALVRYAHDLAWMAKELGRTHEAQGWLDETERRSSLIRQYCWDEQQSMFFEYQYTRQRRLPYWTLAAYWTLWAGVASAEEAAALVRHLDRFEHPFGVAQTAEKYPSPHPEWDNLQWDYPSGWPPFHIILYQGLMKYGYETEAKRIATKYLNLQLAIYKQTGKLWEKYNVVEGNLSLPRERYDVVPLHGFSCASLVYLGRQLF